MLGVLIRPVETLNVKLRNSRYEGLLLKVIRIMKSTERPEDYKLRGIGKILFIESLKLYLSRSFGILKKARS